MCLKLNKNYFMYFKKEESCRLNQVTSTNQFEFKAWMMSLGLILSTVLCPAFPGNPVTIVALPVRAIRYLSVSWGCILSPQCTQRKECPLPPHPTLTGHTNSGIASHLALTGLCPFLNQPLWAGRSMVTFPPGVSSTQTTRTASTEQWVSPGKSGCTTRGRRKRKQESHIGSLA